MRQQNIIDYFFNQYIEVQKKLLGKKGTRLLFPEKGTRLLFPVNIEVQEKGTRLLFPFEKKGTRLLYPVNIEVQKKGTRLLFPFVKFSQNSRSHHSPLAVSCSHGKKRYQKRYQVTFSLLTAVKACSDELKAARGE